MSSPIKRPITLLASLLAGFAVLTANAQTGQSPMPSFDGAMEKLFGGHKAFSADLEMHVSRAPGNEITMPGRLSVLDGKFHFEMDMMKMQGAQIPPEALTRMKQMGMGTVATITRRADKTAMTYIIYPDIKAYVEQSTADTSGASRQISRPR